jgi:hypothetical protein
MEQGAELNLAEVLGCILHIDANDHLLPLHGQQ